MKHIKYFEQIYWGTEAAGIVPFCKTTKRFLVGLRSYSVLEPGTYGGFGGKFDDDYDTAENVAKRELEEETEYNGEIDLIVGYIFTAKNFKYHNFIGVVPHEFEPILNWENDNYKWLTLEQLIKLPKKHPGLKAFIEHSMNIFKKLVV